MEKQLGCMNGIFQLFDRHHFLTGRRASGHSQKRLPPDQNGYPGTERNYAKEKFPENVLEAGKERHRIQVESSRTSFSSSCSSTFSSVDCNKNVQQEPPSFCQSIVTEIPPTIVPMKQSNSSLRLGQQSLDLRDVVKDSMYREARGLSVKTMVKDEKKGHALKHVDSPRPLQQSQAVQLRVRSYDGPPRGLAKFREAPRNSKEEKDGRLPSAQKDARRFSYDGRETRDAWKTTLKLKELPRLSLDSKERSIRSSASESRSNISRDTHGENVNSSQLLNPDQEPGSNKRPSTIVARLMGLEAFPDSSFEGQMMETSRLDQNLVTTPRSSRTEDGSKQNQVSRSPRVPHKDPASPQSRNANPVMTRTSSSRLPLEPAVWKQAEGSRGSRKPVFKSSEASAKTPNAASSVYGEIEKRLTDLEFKKSGKDLRALKQILEAMQREKLENRLEEQPSSVESQTSGYSPSSSCFENSKFAIHHSQQNNHPVSPTIKGTSPQNRYGSPILIVKPAKMMDRPRNSNSSMISADGMSGLRKLRTGDTADRKIALVDRLTAKSPSPRNNHLRGRPLPSTDKKANAKTPLSSISSPLSSISSRAPQNTSGEDITSFRRISGTVSPRLQQNKHGMEKQSRPTTPDLNRIRRQSSKQTVDSGSITKKQKPKSTNLQQGDYQSSGFSDETRSLIYHGDTVSLQSESNNSMDSGVDAGVTSADCTNEINGKQPPKNFAARLREDRSIPALATATLEQPSPVSVLDATFYGEDSPSPVKKISNAFEGDDETLNCNEAEWNALDIDHLQNKPNFRSEYNDEKLEHIKDIVHNLRLTNSTHDEATINCIASPCENTNPDQRYITEILLASDFLKDLGSSRTTIQLHQSGHLIKPNLFHALENIKEGIELTYDKHQDKTARIMSNEKLRRKLIFDAVNEILVPKLALAGFAELWMFPNKLGGIPLSREKLLKELQSEIFHLQAKPECKVDHEEDGLIHILSSDMMNQSEDWTNNCDELPGLVLDIERQIFKDLISEIVSGEAAALQDRPGRHCRQLFCK